MKKLIWQYLALLVLAAPAYAQRPPQQLAPRATNSVQIEQLTWPEIKALMGQQYDTVIIPSGGTEQNGPHLAAGKHNAIVGYTAEAIARKVGRALVAPVIAYVPEGNINPPDGHMGFPGTISVRPETYAAVLEDAARSFKQHGFKLICLVGDHGGDIKPQEEVAARLSREWQAEGVRVMSLSGYYLANGQEKWVDQLNIGVSKPNAHAGFADTSELLAVAPSLVRTGEIREFEEKDFPATGVQGNPKMANSDYGQSLLTFKIDTAARQIERWRSEQEKPAP